MTDAEKIEKLRNALRAVDLFYARGPFGEDHKREWYLCTGEHEATHPGMLRAVRKALEETKDEQSEQ